MKTNVLFVSMIALLTVLTGAIILSGCGNATGGGGSSGGTAFSATIYVSNTGSDDAGNGSSSNPYKTIQHALNICASRDVIGIYDGLYKEHITWTTRESVTLKGESRDGAILSGEASGRCIFIESTSATNQTITLESLTITNCYIAGSGGSIYINREGITLHLKNVSMTNNSVGTATYYGGAIYGKYADDNVAAENCSFESNTGRSGGAIFLSSGSGAVGAGLTAKNCTFSGNLARSGGAIYVPYITLEACSLSGNRATNAAGYADSGAVFVHSGGTMTNCLFFNNQVNTTGDNGWGGAIRQYSDGSASDATLEIVNCTFVSNEVHSSGGTSNCGAILGWASTKLTNCILWGNIASSSNQLNTSCTVDHSDVQGTYSGTKIVNVDPQFSGSTPYSAASDFTLTASSSTDVTHGGTTEAAPSKDYSGHSRTGHNSMGAYQH
jgi:predicted outer membrane repeat protein